MQRLHEPSEFDEAKESLRLIRETMERSTKHSSLSGLAGLLIGAWAILGVVATARIGDSYAVLSVHPLRLAAIWSAVLIASAVTDFVLNKRRAVRVGKTVFSALGARILQAAGPSFVAGGIVTAFLWHAHMIGFVFAFWMLAYGLAICAVGLFSVKQVSVLGWAFIAAGCITLIAGPAFPLAMMAISFGGFHIVYGLYTGLTRREW